jgi:hypothetical protein
MSIQKLKPQKTLKIKGAFFDKRREKHKKANITLQKTHLSDIISRYGVFFVLYKIA